MAGGDHVAVLRVRIGKDCTMETVWTILAVLGIWVALQFVMRKAGLPT